jgi:GTP-binding protein HflX
MAQVEAVLRELEVGEKKQIQVMNKIDLLEPEKRKSLIDDDATIHVSAAKGYGLNELLAAIDRALQEDPVREAQLVVPIADGKALSILDAKARIESREYRDGCVELNVHAPESVLRRVAHYVTAKKDAGP